MDIDKTEISKYEQEMRKSDPDYTFPIQGMIASAFISKHEGLKEKKRLAYEAFINENLCFFELKKK